MAGKQPQTMTIKAKRNFFLEDGALCTPEDKKPATVPYQTGLLLVSTGKAEEVKNAKVAE